MLALADKRPPLDAALMAEQLGVEAVVCLGDLDRAWIEPLARLRLPRLGVHGNHDPPGLLREVEVEDLHGRRTSLGGLTVAGFEGCVRYGDGGAYHRTQKQGGKLARRLPAADVRCATARRAGSTTIRTIPRTSAGTGCASGSSDTGRDTCCTVTPIRSEAASSRATPARACTGSRARGWSGSIRKGADPGMDSSGQLR